MRRGLATYATLRFAPKPFDLALHISHLGDQLPQRVDLRVACPIDRTNHAAARLSLRVLDRAENVGDRIEDLLVDLGL